MRPLVTVHPCHRHDQDPQQCTFAIGSCNESGSLEHLHNEDKARKAAGQEPLYLAERLSKHGDLILTYLMTGPLSDRFVGLEFPNPSMTDSQLLLDVSADNLNFIERFPPAEVCAGCSDSILPPEQVFL